MKLTKQQLKQIIKEELMNETPPDDDDSTKNLKIILDRFQKMRTRLELEFKKFGYQSSKDGKEYNKTIYKARRLIRDFNLSTLEDDLVSAVTNGYYHQSAGLR